MQKGHSVFNGSTTDIQRLFVDLSRLDEINVFEGFQKSRSNRQTNVLKFLAPCSGDSGIQSKIWRVIERANKSESSVLYCECWFLPYTYFIFNLI